jgi:adenosine deaminase
MIDFQPMALRSRIFCRLAISAASILVFASIAGAQAQPSSAPTDSEKAASRALDDARKNPLELRDFLVRMPKGADLHIHLSGEVYAESWIKDGAADGLCVDLKSFTFFAPDHSGAASSTPNSSKASTCRDGSAPVAKAFSDQNLYDQIVDALSMRAFVPYAGESAHDHFFATFAKFFAASRDHVPESLDEVATRAAAQNEQYLEIMDTPDFSHTAALAQKLGWNPDLAQFREQLLASGLRDDVAVAQQEFDGAENGRRALEHCNDGQRQAVACGVNIKFLYQVLRGFPKEIVFAQLVLAFEVASADPANVVGVNIVMPEDGYISMSDYALHMQMFDFLHQKYPQVHISLHAGELAPGLVTYEGLCCHVRLALEDGHAERIGHGVDIIYEKNPEALLKDMAANHVMAEINLTSNDVILGISGANHPFPIYRAHHVPVALSTDDEGVSRIDLTHEFQRAVETYNLNYSDLKTLARTGIEHSFLPGQSLWREKDDFSRPVAACASDKPRTAQKSAACAEFLKSNQKAAEQWKLEERFAEFEASFTPPAHPAPARQ